MMEAIEKRAFYEKKKIVRDILPINKKIDKCYKILSKNECNHYDINPCKWTKRKRGFIWYNYDERYGHQKTERCQRCMVRTQFLWDLINKYEKIKDRQLERRTKTQLFKNAQKLRELQIKLNKKIRNYDAS